MAYHSILFERNDDRVTNETPEAPVFFGDLNLDQVIDAITAGKREYNLKPFYYNCLRDMATVEYRYQIMAGSRK